MSSDERIRLELERTGDRWALELDVDEHRQRLTGDGPGEVLELAGQHLDAREAARLDRAHGFAPERAYTVAGAMTGETYAVNISAAIVIDRYGFAGYGPGSRPFEPGELAEILEALDVGEVWRQYPDARGIRITRVR